MEDIFKKCEVQINKIEAELMAFTEWLQFVLIPRVHSILETNGTFPKQSNVAAHAYREFDGMEQEYGDLCQLLSEFDALFN